jgi:hypothetical protein
VAAAGAAPVVAAEHIRALMLTLPENVSVAGLPLRSRPALLDFSTVTVKLVAAAVPFSETFLHFWPDDVVEVDPDSE